MIKTDLPSYEKRKYEVNKILHKCPWYIRLFTKTPTFEIFQSKESGIGTNTFMKCNKCGKIIDKHY